MSYPQEDTIQAIMEGNCSPVDKNILRALHNSVAADIQRRRNVNQAVI